MYSTYLEKVNDTPIIGGSDAPYQYVAHLGVGLGHI